MRGPIRRSPYFAKQRECLYCHAGIAQQRPVFLVSDTSGQILGPFHAGCAERLKLKVKGAGVGQPQDPANVLGDWPSRREETLPE